MSEAKIKPEVRISGAKLVPSFDGQYMVGTAGEYPADHGRGSQLSGQYIYTSNVVSVSEDKTRVETRNTVYIVESWETDPVMP